MALNLAHDKVWVNKKQYDAAETQYYESLAKINCNGDAHPHELLHHLVEGNSLTAEKPKKSTKNKSKENASAVQSNCVEEPIGTTSLGKSNAKKNNKKKNKSQLNKEDVETLVHCNISSIKKQPNATLNESKRGTSSNNHCTLVSEIAKAREHIKNSLEKMDGMANIGGNPEILHRIEAVEKKVSDLDSLVENLKNLVLDSQKRIAALEGKSGDDKQKPAIVSVKPIKSEADEDDGVDLFASDSDDDEDAARVREERLAAYAAKKSKKPALIAKSSLILDVKPWDDETDLKAMEAKIRTITTDGLLWGASKFVPVAFGIQKLSISCVVEDEKVSIDWLTEEIEKFEDFVQSVDVAAFNKI